MRRLLTKNEVLFISELADLIDKYNVWLICEHSVLDIYVCDENNDEEEISISLRGDIDGDKIRGMLHKNLRLLKLAREAEEMLTKLLGRRSKNYL